MISIFISILSSQMDFKWPCLCWQGMSTHLKVDMTKRWRNGWKRMASVTFITNPLPRYNRTNAFTHEPAQLSIPVTHRVLRLENHLNIKQQQNVTLSQNERNLKIFLRMRFPSANASGAGVLLLILKYGFRLRHQHFFRIRFWEEFQVGRLWEQTCFLDSMFD